MGIFGLTGCAGDQLALLDCEDELLEIVERLDVRDFLMASSANDDIGPLDLALVEGAVASRRDEQALRRIRERSRLVVALGTCAVWGGVAAMDRFADRELLLREIYGEAGAGYDSLPVRALHEVVAVDCALPSCPVEKHELLSALLRHTRPGLASTSFLLLGVTVTDVRVGEGLSPRVEEHLQQLAETILMEIRPPS
jgi:coenzyme F420-reducing hydrogenase gamma subunit